MKLFKNQKDELILRKIKNKIKKAEVISFDIFDTLLVRPYIKPTDLFTHMEKALDCPGFESERRDAERRCRIRNKELEDITFDMIYDEIDEEYKHMKQKEMDWEEMVLRANPELKQVYDYAQKLGKKIIIASDMYMPSEFLEKVLKKNGFKDFDKLYVSGELCLTKRHGSIWNKIIEELNIKPSQILHIGDNERSDYDSPKKYSINAILSPRVLNQYIQADKRIEQFINSTNGALGASILAGFLANKWQENRCNNTKQDYWSWLGYNYAGPLNYAYARFIEQDVKKNNINNVMFVAREGYILKQVFEKFNTGIKTNYIYAQRAINLTTRLDYNPKDINHTSFVVDFFANKNDEIKEKMLKQTFVDSSDYHNFIQRNYSLFEAEAKKCSDNFEKYIQDKVNTNDNIAAVFDMGRSFAGLKLLRHYLGKDVRGIFFVNAGELLDKNNAVWANTSYSDEKIFQKSNEEIFSNKWEFIEFLISSPESSVREIDENGEALFCDNINTFEKERQCIYPQIVKSALEYSSEINEYFGNCDVYFDYKTIIKWINCFIENYSAADIKYWNKISFFALVDNITPTFSFSAQFNILEYLFASNKVKVSLNKVLWKTKFQKRYLKNWGIYEEKTPTTDIKRFFGLTLYKKSIESTETKTTRCFGLLKTKETQERKKRYFCGIKISDREKSLKLSDVQKLLVETNNKAINEIAKKVQRQLTIANLHQKTFSEFRNKHQGQTLALVGAGPSVKYMVPVENAKYVGLNRAFLLDKVKFDYLFTIDKAGLNTGAEQFYNGFLKYDCIKFVGDQNLGKNFQHPQSVSYADLKTRRYKTTANHLPFVCSLDIDTEALGNACSCSIQAMQFILFTNPKNVYIYGIDCTCASGGHFIGGSVDNNIRGENASFMDLKHVKYWMQIKEFANIYYPETEIIVVNPVGLKGIFKDVYTESYLQKHPEINPELVEILKEEQVV